MEGTPLLRLFCLDLASLATLCRGLGWPLFPYFGQNTPAGFNQRGAPFRAFLPPESENILRAKVS